MLRGPASNQKRSWGARGLASRDAQPGDAHQSDRRRQQGADAAVDKHRRDRVTHVYLGDTLIRSLILDPNRYYQPMEPTPQRPTTS